MKWPENKHWHDKYMFDIPVCHFMDKEIFRHRVNDEDALIKIIEAEFEASESKK